MNADTKKKIEDAAFEHGMTETRDAWDDDSYIIGASFGYSLALEQAEILVKALEEHSGLLYDEIGGKKSVADCALDEWLKLTNA